MDDLAQLRRMRDDVPPPSARALADAERRLAQAAAGPRPRVQRRLAFAAGLTAALTATVVGVGAVTIGGRNPIGPQANAAVATLRLASAAAMRDGLNPKAGQFISAQARREDFTTRASTRSGEKQT